MKRLILALGLLAVTWFIGTFVVTELKAYINNASLIMSGISSNTIQTIVREHINADILGDGVTLNDTAQIHIQTAYINDDSNKDIIATTESAETCGTGGCITTIYLQNEINEFVPISFAYAVKEILVENSMTNHMHDLRINNNNENIMVWNGDAYTLGSF